MATSRAGCTDDRESSWCILTLPDVGPISAHSTALLREIRWPCTMSGPWLCSFEFMASVSNSVSQSDLSVQCRCRSIDVAASGQSVLPQKSFSVRRGTHNLLKKPGVFRRTGVLQRFFSAVGSSPSKTSRRHLHLLQATSSYEPYYLTQSCPTSTPTSTSPC